MDITSYLIVSAASLGMAYCLYSLFFRNELRFGSQRIFLLGSIAISVLLPLTRLSIHFTEVKSYPAGINVLALTETTAAQPIIAENGLIRLFTENKGNMYLIVTALFILILAFQFLKILHLYHCSEKTRIGEILILRNENIKSPFSFFQWVFIPESISESEEVNSIIIHERVHSENLHSLDNLIFEFITAFMWFNPFIWMMKRSMHLVHEYLADQGTLEAGVERTRYQAILVNQVAEERLISISSSFNNNLKKRMIMMTKSKNTGRSKSGIMKIIPLSAIMFLAVAVMNGLIFHDANASVGNQEKTQKNDKEKNKEIVVTGYAAKPGASKQGNDTMNYIVDGVSMKNIDYLSPDSIESVNVLKEDNTIVIRTKSFARKQVQDSKINIATGPDKVLYLKDGLPISEEEMRTIDPSDIARLDVIKRKESIKEYTDKDFDGVILITTKK